VLAEEGDDFGGHFLFMSPPEVIGSRHNDDATALRQGDAWRLKVWGGGHGVPLTEEEQDRATRPDGGGCSSGKGRRDSGKRGERRIRSRKGNDGAEGVTRQAYSSPVDAGLGRQEIKRCSNVFPFVDPAAVGALAASRATKIEPQGDESLGREGIADGDDDCVVHVAAVERVRVTDDGAGGGRGLRLSGGVQYALKSQVFYAEGHRLDHRSPTASPEPSATGQNRVLYFVATGE
jgi:hypothetical protein